MGYFTDTLRAMGHTMRSVFRKPTTVEFPRVIRERAERYRASFALLHEADGDEACIGCLQCERICPSQVIKIKGTGKKESPITGKKRGYAEDFVLDLSACIFCELCVQVCPTDAIVMTREQEEPTYSREDLVLTMAKLYANEKIKLRSWGDGTRLMDMQNPKKGLPVPPAPPAAVAAPVRAEPVEARPVVPAPAGPSTSSGQTGSGQTDPDKDGGQPNVIAELVFAAVCAVTFFAAIRVVATPNLVRAVFWLALSLLGTAALYAMLNAPFLAGVQVLTYVGGVVTLMIFGVMVTRAHDGTAVVAESGDQSRAFVVSFGVGALLILAIWKTELPPVAVVPPQPTTELARALLGRHLVAFEVASLLLLAAIVGAVVLARKKDPDPLTRREPLPTLTNPPEGAAP